MKRLLLPCFRVFPRLLEVHAAKGVNYFGSFSRILHRCFAPRVERQHIALLYTNVYKSTDRITPTAEHINDHFVDALKYKDVQKTLELFDLAKREGIIPQAKIFSQAIHLLLNQNEHNKLDELYEDMNKYGFKTGEGVRMTLIRSYVCRKMWSHAMDVLDGIEKEQLMRHTRHYNPIIKGLAEHNLVHEAFQLFERKLKMFHCISSGSEIITRDTEMLVSMIESCFSNDTSQETITKINDQTFDNGNQTLNGNIDNQPFSNRNLNNQLTSTKDDGKLDNMTANVSKHLLVYKLFQFFYKVGMKFTPSILDACKEWSAHDDSYSWSWKVCGVNKAGKCNICGTFLCLDLPNDYFKNLQSELIKILSGGNGKLELTPDEVKELSYVGDLCQDKGPFDVIIDAQNLGLEGKRKGVSSPYFTKMYEKRIVEVVKNFARQNKTIFLPLHVKAMNDISGNTLTFLRNNCEVYIVKTIIDEDLVLLYAAALSGLDDNSTCIVTNDNWRDHSAMLSEDNHWKLLKWARLNHVSFTLTHKNKVKLYKNIFDPVILKTDSSWHFPMDSGHWQCVKLKRK